MSNVTCPRCGRLLSTMADFAHRDCPGYTGNGNPLDGIPVPMTSAEEADARDAAAFAAFREASKPKEEG